MTIATPNKAELATMSTLDRREQYRRDTIFESMKRLQMIRDGAMRAKSGGLAHVEGGLV